MNLEKFTIKAQESIMNSQGLAQERNHQAIDTLHLLYSRKFLLR